MVDIQIMPEIWKNAKKDIFRLEALPIYNVTEDFDLFRKWEKGKLNINLDFKKWLKNIKTTKSKGIRIRRVRVVQPRISDYLKYEIDVWKRTTKKGEEVYFIKSDDYTNLKKLFNFEFKDFWMFDNKVLLIFHYSKNGNFVKEELIIKEDILAYYKKLKSNLLKQCLPMNKFIKK